MADPDDKVDPPNPPDPPKVDPVPDPPVVPDPPKPDDIPADIPAWGKRLFEDVKTLIDGAAKPPPPTDPPDPATPPTDPPKVPNDGKEIEGEPQTKGPWHKRRVVKGKWTKGDKE